MAQALKIQNMVVPAAIMSLGNELELSAVDRQAAYQLTMDYRAKPESIKSLVTQFGLTIQEVAVVYDARNRVNEGLSGGQSQFVQAISLTQLAAFQQTFRSVSDDAESLARQVLDIHQQFQHRYLSHVLKNISDMSERHPDVLPEALADFLAASAGYSSQSED